MRLLDKLIMMKMSMFDEGPRLRQVRSIPGKRRAKAWKALDKPWRWCYNRVTEIHALLSWDHGSTLLGPCVIDSEDVGQLLVDDHIPV